MFATTNGGLVRSRGLSPDWLNDVHAGHTHGGCATARLRRAFREARLDRVPKTSQVSSEDRLAREKGQSQRSGFAVRKSVLASIWHAGFRRNMPDCATVDRPAGDQIVSSKSLAATVLVSRLELFEAGSSLAHREVAGTSLFPAWRAERPRSSLSLNGRASAQWPRSRRNAVVRCRTGPRVATSINIPLTETEAARDNRDSPRPCRRHTRLNGEGAARR
jgi:hypothetical protein